MDELQALIGSGNGWAQQKASLALEFSQQYQSGQMSKEEYTELLQDLIRTDRLDEECSDVEMKSMLVTGVMGLIAIA